MTYSQYAFLFQSTLPHGERQRCRCVPIQPDRFQSTLPHGERHYIHSRIGVVGYISIHSPAWGETTAPPFAITPDVISIHSPAWGETAINVELTSTPLFQSTLPHGERRKSKPPFRRQSNFNPLSRMGRDRQHGYLYCYPRHFNPLSRMGRDITKRRTATSIDISIHSPAWGETSLLFRAPVPTRISIHSPAWGETRCRR